MGQNPDSGLEIQPFYRIWLAGLEPDYLRLRSCHHLVGLLLENKNAGSLVSLTRPPRLLAEYFEIFTTPTRVPCRAGYGLPDYQIRFRITGLPDGRISRLTGLAGLPD